MSYRYGRQTYLLLLTFLFATLPQVAAPLYTEKIMCGAVECGVMDINTYEEHKNDQFGGVLIEGMFTASRPATYHYMQSVLQTTERKWIDGTPLPVPYVDTPPGGYMDDEFDYLPYYDEGEFPKFHDRPSRFLTRADAGKVTFQWETWIVCVIEEKMGTEAKQAQDDFYTLALLPMGFTWGFTIEKTGKGMTKDDYTVKKLDFTWLGAPSALFTKSWDTVYGAGKMTDRYNLTAGDCRNCFAGIPEPGTGTTVAYAVVLLAVLRLIRWRRA